MGGKASTEQRAAGARDEFERLIESYAVAAGREEQARIRDFIWQTFGTTGTTFISDMSSFSASARALGICHFLKLIYRARQTVAPLIADNSGTLLKCDADNCYAFFESTDNAIQASADINETLFRANQDLPLEDHIHLSVGIDYGELLLIGSEDFFGDPVNTASKLGEDLAIKGETLVTERAVASSSFVANENVERMVARISNIEISYLRLPMISPSTDP